MLAAVTDATKVVFIANPNNPTGNLHARRDIQAILEASPGLVVVDEAYTPFAQESFLGELPSHANLLVMRTVSKIGLAGLRLGWIQGSTALMERILATGVVNSGGSFNHFTSQVMRHAIDLGLQQAMLDHVRDAYSRRLDTMEHALRNEFGDMATWSTPSGGYFFWLELDERIDAAALKSRALSAGAGYQPGSVFSSTGGYGNYIRLSFAHYRREQIREGISRLAGVLSRA